jgi:hypothetical protein
MHESTYSWAVLTNAEFLLLSVCVLHMGSMEELVNITASVLT